MDGGIALTVLVRASSTEFHGWGYIVQYAGSDRDRHCFCRICGTSIFVRHVAPDAMDGMISLSTGTFDDPRPLRLAAETCIDCKPECYALAGDCHRLTQAEVEGMFA